MKEGLKGGRRRGGKGWRLRKGFEKGYDKVVWRDGALSKKRYKDLVRIRIIHECDVFRYLCEGVRYVSTSLTHITVHSIPLETSDDINLTFLMRSCSNDN